MDIEFRRTDTGYIIVEEQIKYLAELICSIPEFVEIICDLLLTITETNNRITADIQELLDLEKYKVDECDVEAYNELCEKMIEYYMLIQDFDFDSKLKQYHEEQYNSYRLYENEKKMNLLRGLLFEAIVGKLIERRACGKQYDKGCIVYINNRQVIVRYNNGHRKETFDFAMWDSSIKYGEFYECKIRPEKFGDENYQLFLELSKRLSRDKKNSYAFFVIVADSKNYIEQRIKKIEEGSDIKLSNLYCFGRENLTEISNVKPII